MRVLIVGAGIGGLTLAGLLCRRGVAPVVVEKAPDFSRTGYMLGLYPLGGRVLHTLGLHDRYVAESQPANQYSLWNSRGRHVATYSLADFARDYGPYQIVSRKQLIDYLLEAAADADVRTDTTVSELSQVEDFVTVRLSDETEMAFDLVVGADGMFSSLRDRVFGPAPFRKTRWGGWIWWAGADLGAKDLVTEYWVRNAFLGVYPTAGPAGIFLGGPNAQLQHAELPEVREFFDTHFGTFSGPAAHLLDTLNDTAEPFYWELLDVRAEQWVRGRVVLLGDAAAGFLPTAGIGASMAMESAAVLDDELSRTDPTYVPSALRYYVQRRRKRVESIQNNSRGLARLMFTSSRPITTARDVLMNFMTLDQALKPIKDAMEQPL